MDRKSKNSVYRRLKSTPRSFWLKAFDKKTFDKKAPLLTKKAPFVKLSHFGKSPFCSKRPNFLANTFTWNIRPHVLAKDPYFDKNAPLLTKKTSLEKASHFSKGPFMLQKAQLFSKPLILNIRPHVLTKGQLFDKKGPTFDNLDSTWKASHFGKDAFL